MKRALSILIIALSPLCYLAIAQSSASFPPSVLTAKTVAVINDTKSGPVVDGAVNALKAWGQFTVVDDPESADITLRFDKSTQHEGQATQKTDANGNPTESNYNLSFSAQIRMKAYYKDANSPFYTTKTDESKAKAGISCVNDFRNAYRIAHQQHP
jgi:hypothetical protein